MSSGHDDVPAQSTLVDRTPSTAAARGPSPVDAPASRVARDGSSGRLPYADRIPTHYEVLGVASDATTPDIRASYRARARVHHPDRTVEGVGDVSMAQINEAYRVLKDPARRALYDRSLATARTAADPTDVTRDHVHDVDEVGEVDPNLVRGARSNPLSPDGPARFPWRSMLVLAVVGSLLVLVSAALADPPAEEVPDGILRTDSCIVIEPNGDAREVACTGEDDIVVELLLPTDARCPVGMEPHRDRLGLGIACIVP